MSWMDAKRENVQERNKKRNFLDRISLENT